MAFPCTCQQPLQVDLSSTADCREKLVANLQHSGWSPILVELDISPPSHDEIVQFFKKSDPPSKKSLVYRCAESGGEEDIEPKESLELSLSRAFTDEPDATKIHSWCLALSQVAHKVCGMLDAPPNTLLDSDSKESLDLLRVFYYHATDDATTSTTKLGSSAHTDWGSWTVVWQDYVGGLETYCRACQKWVGVPAPTMKKDENNNAWRCVVHVGDMASLALENAPNEHEHQASIQWPSPRHRVVCSGKERTSLVYFGYPPAHASLKDMQERLLSWQTSNRGRRLPLEEYYLLHDQSTGKQSKSKSPKEMYHSIESLSVQGVIQEKWDQVQRS